MKRARNKESQDMNGHTTGVAFELRANVAIRILVERVELEPSPGLTIDHGAARRAHWQSIARSAVEALGAPVLDAPAPVAKRPYKRREPRDLLPAARPIAGTPDTFACLVCSKPYTPLPQHRHKQRTCGRPKCQLQAKHLAQAERRRRLAAGGAA